MVVVAAFDRTLTILTQGLAVAARLGTRVVALPAMRGVIGRIYAACTA